MMRQTTRTQTEGQTPRRLFDRIYGRWTIPGAFVILLVGYLFVAQGAAPEHKVEMFHQALEHSNADRMLALSDPAEVQHLSLTPQKLLALMADAARSPGGLRFISPRQEQLNEAQTRYNRAVRYTLADQHGHVLTSPDGKASTVVVVAYNSPTGWHIALSKFLSNLSSARGHGRYIGLCQSQGVPTEYFEPASASWVVLGNR